MPRSLKKTAIIVIAAGSLALLGTTTVLATAEPVQSSGPVERWQALANERLGNPRIPNQFMELIAISERVTSAEQRTYERAAELLSEEQLNSYTQEFDGLTTNIGTWNTDGYNKHTTSAAAVLNSELLATLDDAGILKDIDTLLNSANRLVPETQPADTLIETELPYLNEIRTLAKLQGLRITTALETGNANDAIELFEDSLRLVETCNINPTIIDQLVAASISAILTNAIATATPAKTVLTAAQFQRLESILNDPVLQADMHYGMKGERLFMEQMLDLTHTEGGRFLPGELQPYVDMGSKSNVPTALMNIAGIVFPTREQTESKLRHFYKIIDEIIDERDPARRKELARSFDKEFDELGPFYAVINVLMPAFSNIAETAYRVDDGRQRAMINVAAIRYQTVEGLPPQDSQILVEAGLISPQTTVSPSTGQPIRLSQLHPADRPDLRR